MTWFKSRPTREELDLYREDPKENNIHYRYNAAALELWRPADKFLQTIELTSYRSEIGSCWRHPAPSLVARFGGTERSRPPLAGDALIF